jgi:hypothetical protein
MINLNLMCDVIFPLLSAFKLVVCLVTGYYMFKLLLLTQLVSNFADKCDLL